MACEECALNCQLVHRKKKDLSSSVVRFIRFVFSDDLSELLGLPPRFAKTISHLVGKETTVEDSTGAQWTVTLSNHKGFLSFHKGWKKFATDHRLQVGDSLVFNYLKKGHFVVHIYARNCTERTDFSNKICPVKRARTTEKVASKAAFSQGNATNDVNFDNVCQPNKKARASGVQARNILEMGTGDGVTTDTTSAMNQESSSTSTPVVPNFDDHLNQPQTSYDPLKPKMGNKEQPCLDVMNRGACYAECPLKPKIGNKEQPCLDDASCVIMDRGVCYAESEKGTVLYDLSVFEMHKNELISGTRCIHGDEDIHTHAQTNVASRAEANLFEGNNTGSAINACSSKVDQTGMIQIKKGVGHVDKMPVECKKVLSDKYGFSHRTSVKLDDKCRIADSISKDPWQDAKQRKENSSNCDDSPFRNEYASALPRQGMAVNSKDAHHTIKEVKKEQVQLRGQVSDHAQKSKDLKHSSMREDGTSSKSRFKQEAVEMDPDYSRHVSASLSASISCLAVTDNRDFVELPNRLPSITFRKIKGREDKKCAVMLLDPKERSWPAIYYEKFGFCILICGWKRFNEANNAGPGDSYVFSLEEDDSQCLLYKVDVVSDIRDV